MSLSPGRDPPGSRDGVSRRVTLRHPTGLVHGTPIRGWDDNACNRFITKSALHSVGAGSGDFGHSPPILRRFHVLSRTDDLALLMGRVFVAALFLPHGFHMLMNFWSFAASLGAKGVPYSNAIAVLTVAAEVIGPLTLILGLWPRWTALALAVLTILTISIAYRSGMWGAVFLPRRNLDLYRNLAILGGLLFYFVSGPGAWSLRKESTRA